MSGFRVFNIKEKEKTYFCENFSTDFILVPYIM